MADEGLAVVAAVLAAFIEEAEAWDVLRTNPLPLGPFFLLGHAALGCQGGARW